MKESPKFGGEVYFQNGRNRLKKTVPTPYPSREIEEMPIASAMNSSPFVLTELNWGPKICYFVGMRFSSWERILPFAKSKAQREGIWKKETFAEVSKCMLFTGSSTYHINPYLLLQGGGSVWFKESGVRIRGRTLKSWLAAYSCVTLSSLILTLFIWETK